MVYNINYQVVDYSVFLFDFDEFFMLYFGQFSLKDNLMHIVFIIVVK